MNGTITQCTQHCFMIKTTVCSNFNMCNEKRVTSNVFNSKTREINHHCAFISCYFIGKMCSTIFLFIIHYLNTKQEKLKTATSIPRTISITVCVENDFDLNAKKYMKSKSGIFKPKQNMLFPCASIQHTIKQIGKVTYFIIVYGAHNNNFSSSLLTIVCTSSPLFRKMKLNC